MTAIFDVSIRGERLRLLSPEEAHLLIQGLSVCLSAYENGEKWTWSAPDGRDRIVVRMVSGKLPELKKLRPGL